MTVMSISFKDSDRYFSEKVLIALKAHCCSRWHNSDDSESDIFDRSYF